MQNAVNPRAGCHQAMEKGEKIEDAGTDAAVTTPAEGSTAAEPKTEEVKVSNPLRFCACACQFGSS